MQAIQELGATEFNKARVKWTSVITCGNDNSLVFDWNFFIISAIETNGAGAACSRT
jgi:hypothetical protein